MKSIGSEIHRKNRLEKALSNKRIGFQAKTDFSPPEKISCKEC